MGCSGPCFDHTDPLLSHTVVMPSSRAGTRLRARSSNSAALRAAIGIPRDQRAIGLRVGFGAEVHCADIPDVVEGRAKADAVQNTLRVIAAAIGEHEPRPGRPGDARVQRQDRA